MPSNYMHDKSICDRPDLPFLIGFDVGTCAQSLRWPAILALRTCSAAEFAVSVVASSALPITPATVSFTCNEHNLVCE